ncbi:MAG: transcription-repair coupling factor [Clostridiales bacterium]|nr:transcription-repair coupling factor [Clostridiales bacterium]
MSCFSEEFNKSKEFSNLSQSVQSMNTPIGVIGLTDVSKCFAVHSLCSSGEKAFIITPDEATAVRVHESLSQLQDGVLLYPSREFTFVEVTGVSRDFEHIRLGVLSNILSGNYSAVVSSVTAACQYTMPPSELEKRSFTIKTNDTIDINDLVERLSAAGYARYDQVDGTSQFAVRGGIVDIFPAFLDSPVRIEFWGDTVDTVSSFDVDSQRRTKNLDSIKIIPANEVLFDSGEELADKIDALAKTLRGKAVKAREKLYADSDRLRSGLTLNCLDKYSPLCFKSNGIFDYFEGRLFAFESARIKEKCNKQERLNSEELKWMIDDGTLCKGLDKFSLTFGELTDIYEKNNAVYLDSLPRGSFDTPVGHLANFRVQSLNVWNGTLTQLKDELFPLIKSGYTVCMAAGTARAGKALESDILDMGFNAVFYEKPPEKFQSKTVNIIIGTMPAGFQISDIKFALITHSKVSQNAKKSKKVNSKNAIHSLDELEKGDYIVHNIHGIGIFEGIHPLEINKVKKDYIKISYAKGDTLYVPVTQLDLVSKYIGPHDNSHVKINSLGSTEWKRTKAKVRSSVKDMAKELISLYAKRMATNGYAFSEDSDMQRDFELRFEYEETDDQLRCAEEIKRDMQRSVPMDRLLCGDVGFGKTEVALRAVFKCVLDSKQCAILVPTTVLAMQHYQTVLKRFEAYPVRIEMLSRFVSLSKQKQILKDAADGKVDIIIGTHKLLGKNIQFKDLGLLIVDEEQRFGVAQKEKIKEKFPRVDVLTLSATPIPRTLNMAMSGIRDMSLLEEAPGERHPVQTYVVEYDDEMITEALEREINRGGQCYYLHNNIDTIEHKAMVIKKAIPDARVGIAHGKMDEEQLSNVWKQLINGEIDILVCTTIIETGVDVPNVNTLVIENADRMGLAQLHQIRGRVGRSSRRAYAYFTFTRGRELSDVATRRLEAIREYTEFGSGFKIAMRDLEIRGAGSLLGNKQHGHMEAVGYDMYIKLLEEAVAMEKGEISEDSVSEKDCLIDLAIDAHIPDTYISSTAHRLSMYKRIANIKNDKDANDVYDEMTDRFGTPPSCVWGLIEIALLRNTAQSLDITEITQRNGSVLLYSSNVDIKTVAVLNAFMKGRVSLSAGKKPYIAVKLSPQESTLETLKEALTLILQAREHIEKVDETHQNS